MYRHSWEVCYWHPGKQGQAASTQAAGPRTVPVNRGPRSQQCPDAETLVSSTFSSFEYSAAWITVFILWAEKLGA